MSFSHILTSKVFNFLNSNAIYAVLRNYEGLPEMNISRDIDILIEKKQYDKIEQKLIDLIISQSFKIISLYRSEKVITLVCAKLYDSKIDLVQFDFFFNTSIFGVYLLNVKNVLDSRAYNGKIYHVSKEYEFLDKYLQIKFLGKDYPKKYNKLKDEIKDNIIFKKLIKNIFGVNNISALANMSTFCFRFKILFRNLKREPFIQIKFILEFLINYVRNFFSYSGFSIGFTGPDGSGKTTIINSLIYKLSLVYSEIQLLHFRPHLTPNLGEIAKKTSLKKNIDTNFSNPHRGSKTNKLSSFFRLLYYSFDYFFGYFIKVRILLQRRSLVVFDRYYSDIISDGKRSKINLNNKLIYYWGKFFIPSLNYNFLISAKSEIILSRKQELNKPSIEKINSNLIFLSKKPDFYLIENNGSMDEALQKILKIIIENQHTRNLKNLHH